MVSLGARVFLLLLLALGAWGKTLPSYIKPCSIKLSDKRMSECALKSAREAWPIVFYGDPEYNTPSLNPLHLDRLVVIDGKGPLGMRLITTDVKLYGLNSTIINSTTHVTNPPTDTYVITIPNLQILAKYNVTGRILLLPIVGQGNVEMVLKYVTVAYQFDWKLEKLEDGITYYLPQPGARLDLDVQGMTVHLDNLFNGDKALLELTNNFLNEEWREVFDSLQPSFAKAISEVITRILSGIFRQVPFKEAFTDVEE